MYKSKQYRSQLINHDLVLILHGRYTVEWWYEAHEVIDSRCSTEEILIVLNMTLSIAADTYSLIEDPTARAYSYSVRTYVVC